MCGMGHSLVNDQKGQDALRLTLPTEPWPTTRSWSGIFLPSWQAVRLTAGCLPGAGATLVELYTGLAYEGPALVPRLKKQLAACLEADGFTSVQDAIGYDHRK